MQKSANGQKKSTDTADTTPNNLIENRSLSSKNTEKKQSGNSKERRRSRSSKKRGPTLLIKIKTWV